MKLGNWLKGAQFLLKNTLILTIVFEAITALFRFGLKLESTRDTGFLKHITFGFRIHHGYIGVVIILLLLLNKNLFGQYSSYVMAIALALVTSDFIHHFLVLWPITGSPEFHIHYPD